MKHQTFGVEIELTGLTRKKASEIIADYFETQSYYIGTNYKTYGAKDTQNREWKIMSDSSIHIESKNGQKAEAVEIVTPILKYNDIDDLQEIVR